MSEWHTAGRETLIQQKLNLGMNGKNIWHLSHNLLPSTTSPSSLHRRSAPSRCGQEYRAVSPDTVSPWKRQAASISSASSLILQKDVLDRHGWQTRPVGRRCLPWPSFCSPPAKTLPQMYPTKDANPSLPCLSLLKGFFRGRRRPGRDRVSLWEGNCCPHPQRLLVRVLHCWEWGMCRHWLYLEQSLDKKSYLRSLLKMVVQEREGLCSIMLVAINKKVNQSEIYENQGKRHKKEKNTVTLKPSCYHIKFGGCGRLWACIRLYALRSNLSWVWGGPASIPQAKHRSRSKIWKCYRFKMLKHNLRTNTD